MYGDNNNELTFYKDKVGAGAYQYLKDFIETQLRLSKEERIRTETTMAKAKYDKEKIIDLIKKGLSLKDIQNELNIGYQPLRNVMSVIYKKYDIKIPAGTKDKFPYLSAYLMNEGKIETPQEKVLDTIGQEKQNVVKTTVNTVTKEKHKLDSIGQNNKTIATIKDYIKILNAKLQDIYNFVGESVLKGLEYDKPQAREEVKKLAAQIEILEQLLKESEEK